MNTYEKGVKYLKSAMGKRLMKQHSLKEKATWEIYVPGDPNLNWDGSIPKKIKFLDGTIHVSRCYSQCIGTVTGTLADALNVALNHKDFWGYCDSVPGGYIWKKEEK